jgi:GT2 family glycosyltransferase
MTIMLDVLNWVKPGWWVLSKRENGGTAFVDLERIDESERAILDLDDGFTSKGGRLLDAAYQGFYRGLVASEETCLKFDHAEELPVEDDYRFLRRYYSKWWAYHVFVMRCLTLRNPVRELVGFLGARKVRRISLWERTLETGESGEKGERITGRVAVVIPTLNRYEYLKDALRDLEAQTYKNFEVIVVDQSQPFDLPFYDVFSLDIKIIRQESPGLWRARNSAVKATDAELILLFDDDSRVAPSWIEAHLSCLEQFDADICSGVSLSTVGDKVPKSYQNFRQADQLDTGNALVKRKVFEKVGLFDLQFEGQRMGDAEFGLRAFLNGFKVISSPLASRIHLKVESGGLRQMGSWDAFRPKSLVAPRPVPSVLYLFRKYFGARAAIKAICILTPPSLIPYRLKGNRPLRGLAYLFAIIFAPVLIIQVVRAWSAASKKLKAGADIPILPSS